MTTFSSEAVIKLRALVTEGVGVLEEVETLNGGLSDTVKAIAAELEIKPATLKRAIKIAYKQKLTETNEENEILNSILITVGQAN